MAPSKLIPTSDREAFFSGGWNNLPHARHLHGNRRSRRAAEMRAIISSSIPVVEKGNCVLLFFPFFVLFVFFVVGLNGFK